MREKLVQSDLEKGPRFQNDVYNFYRECSKASSTRAVVEKLDDFMVSHSSLIKNQVLYLDYTETVMHELEGLQKRIHLMSEQRDINKPGIREMLVEELNVIVYG